MEAYRRQNTTAGMNAEDTIPNWSGRAAGDSCGDAGGDADADGPATERAVDRPSSTRLSAERLARSERPTLPPPEMETARGRGAEDLTVSHIHLGPSVDEVLYRLSLGDLTGAALANEELEGYVPVRNAPPIVVAALQLSYLEEFVLASVDNASTWGELLDNSPFAPRETLRTLCELVDKGAITLNI